LANFCRSPRENDDPEPCSPTTPGSDAEEDPRGAWPAYPTLKPLDEITCKGTYNASMPAVNANRVTPQPEEVLQGDGEDQRPQRQEEEDREDFSSSSHTSDDSSSGLREGSAFLTVMARSSAHVELEQIPRELLLADSDQDER